MSEINEPPDNRVLYLNRNPRQYAANVFKPLMIPASGFRRKDDKGAGMAVRAQEWR